MLLEFLQIEPSISIITCNVCSKVACDFTLQVPRERVSHTHPAMAITVAVQVAAIKDVPVDEVLKATRKNTKFMYKI